MFAQDGPTSRPDDPALDEREAWLAGWTPDLADATAVAPYPVPVDLDLGGCWSRGDLFVETTFELTRLADGCYGVVMKTSGCVGRWESRRRGELVDGVLVLDRAIDDYGGGT